MLKLGANQNKSSPTHLSLRRNTACSYCAGWELVESLKAAGPMTIYALAKRLSRHYRNVHKDVTALMDWMVIEKDEAGRVFVPWDEIDVRWPLVKQTA